MIECHWPQQENICKSQMGQDQVSGGVSVPCWHATPVADALWKPIFGEMSDSVIMSGNNVANWYYV